MVVPANPPLLLIEVCVAPFNVIVLVPALNTPPLIIAIFAPKDKLPAAVKEPVLTVKLLPTDDETAPVVTDPPFIVKKPPMEDTSGSTILPVDIITSYRIVNVVVPLGLIVPVYAAGIRMLLTVMEGTSSKQFALLPLLKTAVWLKRGAPAPPGPPEVVDQLAAFDQFPEAPGATQYLLCAIAPVETNKSRIVKCTSLLMVEYL